MKGLIRVKILKRIMTKSTIIIIISLVFIINFLITGCSLDFNIQNNTPSFKTGQFLGTPVEGVYYNCGSLAGYTDKNGTYRYRDDHLVIFKIGGIELGTVNGDSIITPLDLVSDSDHTNKSVINIVRFIYTLDSDNDLSNGIKIDKNIHELLSNDKIDFKESNESTFVNEAKNLLYICFARFSISQ